MTGLVFARPAGYPRFCRLLTIGTVEHVMGCLSRVDATEHLEIRATEPPRNEICKACRADLDVKRARCKTLDLRPYAGEIGIVAMVDVDRDIETENVA